MAIRIPTSRASRRGIALAAGLMVLVALGATPASAAFPGPNGRIAFGSDRSGSTHNLFTMKPDGTDIRQVTFLTFDQGAALDVAWSADGSRLVYEQRNAD